MTCSANALLPYSTICVMIVEYSIFNDLVLKSNDRGIILCLMNIGYALYPFYPCAFGSPPTDSPGGWLIYLSSTSFLDLIISSFCIRIATFFFFCSRSSSNFLISLSFLLRSLL
jgi:hypothetical protein